MGIFFVHADKANFKEFKEGDRIFGPTLLFLFTVSVTFIMINIFVTVICEAFQQVCMTISWIQILCVKFDFAVPPFCR